MTAPSALVRITGIGTAQLARVARAAEKAARTREELEAAIVAAHESGESLRAIAAAAGTNHEAVRTVIQRRRREP